MIIIHKKYFSSFDTNIEKRLSEQLINRTWGGNIDIQAISELYNVDIRVWELSKTGELSMPFNNTPLTALEGLDSIFLSRHWGNYFDSVVFKSQKYPLN